MDLPTYIQMHEGEPFVLGERDCLTFAVGWVDYLNGSSLAARIRNEVPYTTFRDMRQRYPDAQAFIDIANRLLGPPAADVPQVGDIAVVATGPVRAMLGVVGTRVVHVPSYLGIAAIPQRDVVAYWRPVPCQPLR